jgi:deazaflavin-dependent oxidoreductase (nitroreductase family)
MFKSVLMARARKPVTSENTFSRALKDRRQISISVIGRRSGQTITLPVWFVLAEEALWLLPVHGSQTQWYRNLLMNPAITIKAGGERLTLQARALKGGQAVRRVIRWFREKYTPEIIARLYPGPLNVAVKVRLQHGAGETG